MQIPVPRNVPNTSLGGASLSSEPRLSHLLRSAHSSEVLPSGQVHCTEMLLGSDGMCLLQMLPSDFGTQIVVWELLPCGGAVFTLQVILVGLFYGLLHQRTEPLVQHGRGLDHVLRQGPWRSVSLGSVAPRRSCASCPQTAAPLSWMEAVDTTRKLGGDAALVSLSREDTEDPLGPRRPPGCWSEAGPGGRTPLCRRCERWGCEQKRDTVCLE